MSQVRLIAIKKMPINKGLLTARGKWKGAKKKAALGESWKKARAKSRAERLGEPSGHEAEPAAAPAGRTKEPLSE